MEVPSDEPVVFRPSVEKIAGCIKDPVRRLRFLKSSAPLLSRKRTRGASWLLSLFRKPLIRFVLLTATAIALAVSLILVATSTRASALPAAHLPLRLADDAPPPAVWLVEKSAWEETFSNGLRIDNHFVIAHIPRLYTAFPADRTGRPVRKREPVGIVFHTTESHQVPFEAGSNTQLQKVGESVLEYVRDKFAYHFVIDRFGRVFRIVAEGDSADHAGPSVWADGEWLYINLNASFFGISFEARTEPGQMESAVNPAQVRSAAMLTEMLRSRYHIPAANCVTHAQVSVNPDNGEAGYHTDWASGFPFEQVGLPNNYAQALPAVWAFGFTATPEFRKAVGPRLAEGIDAAEEAMQKAAGRVRNSPKAYRERLLGWYRQHLGLIR